jgi:hypothetical protein
LAPETDDIQQLVDIDALVGDTEGIYNRLGRGVPDVSANGDNIAVCPLSPSICISSFLLFVMDLN